MSYLPCVEVETSPDINASIIWLHGLGANGHDFEPIIPELKLPATAGIRFIFPHAPSIPVTINGGMVMPAWYDIIDIDHMNRKVDLEQIIKSAEQITALVEREIARGTDSRRIIIAGFSQGGAVVYQMALTYPKPLAGLLALSTYFASCETIKTDPANRAIPISIYHGLYDMVVPESLGQHAAATLKSMGYQAEYKTYPMQHSVCAEEISDISHWIRATLDL
ncbi:MAG: dienelactone hydrolase family protein [Gammaproteobacteria bacterium]